MYVWAKGSHGGRGAGQVIFAYKQAYVADFHLMLLQRGFFAGSAYLHFALKGGTNFLYNFHGYTQGPQTLCCDFGNGNLRSRNGAEVPLKSISGFINPNNFRLAIM